MFTLNQLRLRNYLLHRSVDFTFEKGITRIGGENRTGKSLLFAPMQPLLYGKRFGTLPKPSRVELEFARTINERKGTVQQNSFRIDRGKYRLHRDGKDLKPHTIKDAQTIIDDTWSIEYELFIASVHLSGLHLHPLATGTPSKRSEWLSSVLDITTEYDTHHEKALRELRMCKDAHAKMEVYRQEMNSLVKPEVKVTKAEEKATREKLSKARKDLERLISSHGDTSGANTLTTLLEFLSGLSGSKTKGINKLLSSSTLEDVVKDLSSQHREALRAVAEAETAKRIHKQNKSMAKKRQEAFDFLRDNNVGDNLSNAKKKAKSDLKDAEKLLDKMTRRMDKAESQWEAYQSEEGEESREAIKRLTANGKSVPSLEEARKKFKSAQEVLVIRKNDVRQAKTWLEELDDDPNAGQSTCVTCGSKLSGRPVDARRKTLNLLLVKAEKDLDYAKSVVKSMLALTYERVPKPSHEPAAIRQDIEEQIKPSIKLLTKVIKAIDFLQANNPIESDIDSADLDELNKVANRLQKQKETLEDLERLVSRSLNYLPSGFPKKGNNYVSKAVSVLEEVIESQRHVAESRKDLNKRIDKLQRQLEMQMASRQQLKNYTSRKQSLLDASKDYEQRSADLPAWDALAKSFSNSGLRVQHLQESAGFFSQKLTELSGLLFDDTYAFNIEVKPRKLDVMIERKGQVGGLSTLSGSESRIWSLVSALALLHILPSHKRCDTILLDEIEANLDQRTRDRYTLDFLPELQSIVPKCIVITPLVSGEMKLNPDFDYRVSVTQDAHPHSTVTLL